MKNSSAQESDNMWDAVGEDDYVPYSASYIEEALEVKEYLKDLKRKIYTNQVF